MAQNEVTPSEFDFDGWFRWWVTKAPFWYLKHVDLHMFVDQPAQTRSRMRCAEVRACWETNKGVFDSNFVMKHWLLVLIRSVHDKVDREKHGLQDCVSCNLTLYWQSCILRSLGLPHYTIVPSKQAPFRATVDITITGLYEETASITSLDPNRPFALLPNRRICFYSTPFDEDAGLQTPLPHKFVGSLMRFGVRLHDWGCWFVPSSEGTCYVLPFLEYMASLLRDEIKAKIPLPDVLQDVVVSWLGLEMRVPFSALEEHVLCYFQEFCPDERDETSGKRRKVK